MKITHTHTHTYTHTPERPIYRRVLSKLPGFKPLFWAITRFLLRRGGFTYIDTIGGVAVSANCDFMKDPEFLKAYTKGMGQADQSNFWWTLYVTQWAAFHAAQLEGDFVECGTNRGMNAMSIVTYLDFKSLKNRKFYLFDTFCGLDPEFSDPEDVLQYKDSYPDCYQFVVDSFKEYPNVIPVRGSIPGTLSQVDIQKVAFLHIDMNCVKPEIAAIKHFWPKLEVGAIVILDDYGALGLHNKQKKAMDEFASSVGVKILSLPTGQGMMVKPPHGGNTQN